ncbi:MAG: hypothetical protein ACC742_17285 [Thermoanaerobaculales bacterium]
MMSKSIKLGVAFAAALTLTLALATAVLAGSRTVNGVYIHWNAWVTNEGGGVPLLVSWTHHWR